MIDQFLLVDYDQNAKILASIMSLVIQFLRIKKFKCRLGSNCHFERECLFTSH